MNTSWVTSSQKHTPQTNNFPNVVKTRVIQPRPNIPSLKPSTRFFFYKYPHSFSSQNSDIPNSKLRAQFNMSEALHRDYSIGPELGRGSFGTVHRCTSVSTGEPFAVKSINKLLISDPFDLACIAAEPKLTLLASGGPHTVNLHAVYEDPASLHLVLDLCSGPDLLGLLSDRAPLSEADAASLISFIMQALACCHMRGLAHRDLKPENILFDDNTGRPKLSDFGSAGLFSTDKKMSGLVGTAHYVAPEVVRGEEYGERVDVWSAGVVLYVMLGGVHPFAGEDVGEVFSAVLRGNLRFPTRIFGGISREAKDLMRKMMCRDPERRLSAEAVLRHPWIKSGGGVKEH